MLGGVCDEDAYLAEKSHAPPEFFPWDQFFDILGVIYWKLLEKAFNASKTFWQLGKLNDFGKYFWVLLEMLLLPFFLFNIMICISPSRSRKKFILHKLYFLSCLVSCAFGTCCGLKKVKAEKLVHQTGPMLSKIDAYSINFVNLFELVDIYFQSPLTLNNIYHKRLGWYGTSM